MILLISRANSFLFIDSGQIFLTPFDQFSPQSLSSLSLFALYYKFTSTTNKPSMNLLA